VRFDDQLLQHGEGDDVEVGHRHPVMSRQVGSGREGGVGDQGLERHGIDLEGQRLELGEVEAGEHLAADREDQVVAPLHVLGRAGQGAAEADEGIVGFAGGRVSHRGSP
jgi:hypothetical protein